MLTLTYGLEQMEDDDPSEEWFRAVAANFAKIDAHTHNGTDSPALNSVTAVAITTQALLAAAWVSIGDGRYRQLVTLPTVAGTPVQYDSVNIAFRITSSKEIVYASVAKVSATTYYVYTTDNTLDYTAIYST